MQFMISAILWLSTVATSFGQTITPAVPDKTRVVKVPLGGHHKQMGLSELLKENEEALYDYNIDLQTALAEGNDSLKNLHRYLGVAAFVASLGLYKGAYNTHQTLKTMQRSAMKNVIEARKVFKIYFNAYEVPIDVNRWEGSDLGVKWQKDIEFAMSKLKGAKGENLTAYEKFIVEIGSLNYIKRKVPLPEDIVDNISKRKTTLLNEFSDSILGNSKEISIEMIKNKTFIKSRFIEFIDKTYIAKLDAREHINWKEHVAKFETKRTELFAKWKLHQETVQEGGTQFRKGLVKLNGRLLGAGILTGFMIAMIYVEYKGYISSRKTDLTQVLDSASNVEEVREIIQQSDPDEGEYINELWLNSILKTYQGLNETKIKDLYETKEEFKEVAEMFVTEDETYEDIAPLTICEALVRVGHSICDQKFNFHLP